MYNYLTHPSTSVTRMAWAFDDEPVEVWIPPDGFPDRVLTHLCREGEMWAYNAAFERWVLDIFLLGRLRLKLPISQTRCVMAMGYAMSLPGGLGLIAAALGIPERKDQKGYRVMTKLSKPREIKNDCECQHSVYVPSGRACPKCYGTGREVVWWVATPEEERALTEYCRQDVVTERAVAKRVLQLSPAEQKVYELDQEINDRGIAVDRRAVAGAIRLVEKETWRLNDRMAHVTGGKVTACTQSAKLADFLGLDSVAKDVVSAALDEEAEWEGVGGLLWSPSQTEAAKLRWEAAKSSTAKLKPMLQRCSADGRLRGCFQYHGASTGRWAGRGVQVQNLPRPKLAPEWVNLALEMMQRDGDPSEIEFLFGSPMSAVSNCLRGCLVASPGHKLVIMDFAQIESRVLAWLAGDEKQLNVFRTHGKVYEAEAANIYRCSVDEIGKDDPRRQVGKVANLALGYGGGKGAFITMGKGYGVHVNEDEAESIKLAWRAAHAPVVRYWERLNQAAMAAVENPGTAFDVGNVRFKTAGTFLLCKLPSSRVIVYPYPRIQEVKTPWGQMKDALTFMAVDDKTKKWLRTSTHGGKIAENVDQATSACLMREALVRCSQAYPVVLHAHDEGVFEVRTEIAEVAYRRIHEMMTELPTWAAGLPLEAEGSLAERYRK